MSNLVLDSFDWFPTGQSSATRQFLWGANGWFQHSTPVADVTTGRFGYGQALTYNYNTVSGTGDAFYVAPVGATPATGFIGGGMFIYPDMDAANGAVIGFYDGVNDTPQVSILFAANGVVKAYRGSVATGTFLQNSATGSFQEDEWFHVEAKVLVASTGGTVEVRINTVPVLQITGANTQNTGNAYFDSVIVGGYLPVNFKTVHFAFDDMFVNDTTGAQNNTWAGNLRSYGAFMIANGATNNFTIGGSAPASTHWQSVLNNLLDDTKYEYSPNVGDIDLFQPNPVINGPLVRSLQVRMGLRQDDATQRVARAQLRIGTTVYPGSVDQYTNQTYTFYKERWELSPATGVTFTGTEANGLQVGVKVQA